MPEDISRRTRSIIWFQEEERAPQDMPVSTEDFRHLSPRNRPCVERLDTYHKPGPPYHSEVPTSLWTWTSNPGKPSEGPEESTPQTSIVTPPLPWLFFSRPTHPLPRSARPPEPVDPEPDQLGSIPMRAVAIEAHHYASSPRVLVRNPALAPSFHHDPRGPTKDPRRSFVP